jgi:hypothetical protein
MKQSNCAVEFKRARAIWYTQQQAQQRTGSRARTQTRGARREGGQLARLGVGAGARRQTWGRVWWQAAHGWMVRSVSPLVGSGDGPSVHHPRSWIAATPIYIHLLGFWAAETDQVPLPPLDSTIDRRPCPLTANTEWSRTSIITGPSTWVIGSVCYAPQIPCGANLSMTFIPRSPGRRPSVTRPHTPPWVPKSIGWPNLHPWGWRRPWEGRRYGTRSPEDWICAALTTSKADVTAGRAAFWSMGGPPLQDT